ncbi:MAG: asparagine synthase-related protein, partial [Flavisolibacter sp.]
MLYNFLTIGYTGNPGDPKETFYDHVQKLPAASFLTYDFTSGVVELEKYWQIIPQVNNIIFEKDAVEKFGELLSASVKKRLRSDVPIGTSLSGGLDSSSIVALCDEFSSGQYSHKCFTVSFPGFEKDELLHAKTVAQKFGLEHFVVEIDETNIVALMIEVMDHQ